MTYCVLTYIAQFDSSPTRKLLNESNANADSSPSSQFLNFSLLKERERGEEREREREREGESDVKCFIHIPIDLFYSHYFLLYFSYCHISYWRYRKLFLDMCIPGISSFKYMIIHTVCFIRCQRI